MVGEGAEERRLAAIMFTDMVGFSALAQRDETLALDLIEEHRAMLRRAFLDHRGHEVKTTGDGFLVEFASAVAAVRCAVEIQGELAQRNRNAATERVFRVRIGIHLGDVLARADDILGDGVNIAARTESVAEAGGIAITRQVYDQVHNKIAQPLVRIGRLGLKNIQRPVEVYRVELGPSTGAAVAGKPQKFSAAGPAGAKPEKSIAVLPFVNMSPEPESEFLSDGITEDLLNALSGIAELHVAARTSCFAFKGRSDDIRTIGDTLGVDVVLEGSVRKSDSKLRISARLIDVTDGFCRWSGSFDREMQDVFAIQDDITRAILAALKLRLAVNADRPVVKPATTNTGAYELYLKGRFCWNQRGIGLRKALHYFELALIEDPQYGLAWSGLADTYSLLSWYGYLAPAEAIPRATTSARRALLLDPQLAEAHTSLGFCLLCYEWDWMAAELEFRRAVELNPRTVPARYWLGWAYSCAGRHADAIEACRQAVELEPFSPIARTFFGWMHYHAEDFEEAEWQLRKIAEPDVPFAFGRWFLGRVYVAEGKRDQALAALAEANQIANGAAWTKCMLGHAWAVFGETAKATATAVELQDVNRYSYVRAIGVALPHIGLGDRDRALTWLERGCSDRDVWALMMGVDPVYRGLRAEPRFIALLERIGLRGKAISRQFPSEVEPSAEPPSGS